MACCKTSPQLAAPWPGAVLSIKFGDTKRQAPVGGPEPSAPNFARREWGKPGKPGVRPESVLIWRG